MNRKIGTMHGRLSPPYEGRFQAFPAESWRDEFKRAALAGLDTIEWIYEVPHEKDNPLATSEGRDEMRALMNETGVKVMSVCADYYMQSVLISGGNPVAEAFDHLERLIQWSSDLSIEYIVLPFVDQSSLHSPDDRSVLISELKKIAPVAQEAGVELHLETDLPPQEFLSLISEINHPSVRVNYDIGNSASLGFDPEEELTMIGPWLGSVHVKDRLLNGATVPLGTGNADFPTCFRLISDAGYDRPFILQAARGEDGDEVQWMIHNKEFVRQYMIL